MMGGGVKVSYSPDGVFLLEIKIYAQNSIFSQLVLSTIAAQGNVQFLNEIYNITKLKNALCLAN